MVLEFDIDMHVFDFYVRRRFNCLLETFCGAVLWMHSRRCVCISCVHTSHCSGLARPVYKVGHPKMSKDEWWQVFACICTSCPRVPVSAKVQYVHIDIKICQRTVTWKPMFCVISSLYAFQFRIGTACKRLFLVQVDFISARTYVVERFGDNTLIMVSNLFQNIHLVNSWWDKARRLELSILGLSFSVHWISEVKCCCVP